MTIFELKASRMQMMIYEWEVQLRQKVKYGDTTTTTWEEVREMYWVIRNEYLEIDLLDEEFANENQ